MIRPILSTLACLLALTIASPSFADEADRLFAEGGAAFNAQKYDDALRAFEPAWKLRQSYDIAGALAQAEMQTGKHRDAVQHLEGAATGEPSRLPSYVSFGVGGAGLVLGAVTGAVSLAKYGEVKAACSAQLVCPDALRGEADLGKALGHVSTVGFVLAGVGAAAGVTLLVVTPNKSPARGALLVGPGFAGVKGAF